MFTTTVRIASLAVAAAIAGIGAGSASAADVSQTQSVEVRHGDLDLTSAAGVARLDRRIKAAAARACGSYDERDLRMAAEARACRSETIAQARPKVDLAIAQARGGNRLASAAPATIAVP